MTHNAKLIRDLPRLESFRRELASKRSQVKKLGDEINKLDYLVRDLEDITDVVDGVALHISRRKSMYGWVTDIYPIDWDKPFHARVYRDANAKPGARKAYRLRCEWFPSDGKAPTDFMGLWSATEAEAREAGISWAIKGIDPTTGKKYKRPKRSY